MCNGRDSDVLFSIFAVFAQRTQWAGSYALLSESIGQKNREMTQRTLTALRAPNRYDAEMVVG